MPTAAAVPTTAEMAEASRAMSRELNSEVMISSFSKSCRYHLKVNPVKNARDLDSLKENTMRTRMGA